MNADPQFKKGRKFDQVIDGARDVFMREGYEGASVDVIARDAGVSKATLYSYFPDKQALFLAVVDRECDFQRRASANLEFSDVEVPVALKSFGLSLLTFLLSDTGMEVFRVCVAESGRFPELGRAFYETGPKMGHKIIADFLAQPRVAEIYEIDDPWAAADTFTQLLRSDLMLRRLMGVEDVPTPERVEAEVDKAMRTFEARYRR